MRWRRNASTHLALIRVETSQAKKKARHTGRARDFKILRYQDCGR